MKLQALMALLLMAPGLWAALEFETTSVNGGTVGHEQKQFVAKFPFKNTGDSTIKILSANSSCGCTVPALSKDVYAPGESGEITATFDFGARTGRQQKNITVVTDGEPQRITLRLSVTIPEVLTIQPRVVFWNIGAEEIGPKEFQITLGEGVEGEVKLVGDLPEDFDISLAPAASDAADYTVTVLPNTSQPGRAKFKVGAFDAEGNLIADSYCFAIIRVARTSGISTSGNSSAPPAP